MSRWLLVAGALSLLGIIGPALNHIGLREIGIFGYAVVFPVACLGISRAFRGTFDRQQSMDDRMPQKEVRQL